MWSRLGLSFRFGGGFLDFGQPELGIGACRRFVCLRLAVGSSPSRTAGCDKPGKDMLAPARAKAAKSGRKTLMRLLISR
jgi:hypothetical protein